MSDIISFFIDFILNIDEHLYEIVKDYQTWTYLILFIIVFCETGLVVTPFLPGDSLLFAAGAIAAMPGNPISIHLLIIILMIAAFTGDNNNYFVGRFIGEKIYEKNSKLVKREYIDRTKVFYEKHGGKTIAFARFMPILRTFAPFVAGIGKMNYKFFVMYSIIGNILWVNTFVWGGYFFGNIEFVKNNFSLVIIAIIIISLLPPVLTVVKQKLSTK